MKDEKHEFIKLSFRFKRKAILCIIWNIFSLMMTYS